jgi:hypothetical protein
MTDNSNNDPISAAMNMTPMIPGDQPNQVMKLMGDIFDDSAKTDFTTARNNILELINAGKISLDNLVNLASQAQHPRMYEVLAGLIKTLVDANKDLLEIQSKIREIHNSDTPHNTDNKIINNNLFVGSTHELQKMLKTLSNNDRIKDIPRQS